MLIRVIRGQIPYTADSIFGTVIKAASRLITISPVRTIGGRNVKNNITTNIAPKTARLIAIIPRHQFRLRVFQQKIAEGESAEQTANEKQELRAVIRLATVG